MPDRFIESHIKQIPMFQQLPPDQLDMVVQAFQVLRFEPGQVVVQQGQPTQGLFVVVAGSGVLYRDNPDGSRQPVRTLTENSMLDRGALFEGGVEEGTLQVVDSMVILFLARARMTTLLSYYPDIRQRLGASDTGATAPAARTIRPHARGAQGTGHNIQRDNEEIIMIRRRHPWSFIRRGWMALIIFVFFAAAGIASTVIAPLLGMSLIGIGFVLAGLLMTYFYFEWRNDSIVVTDHRVISIERVIPTFSVSINEIPITQIQEVNTELPKGDLFARILDYGDIELKNASDTGNLILDTIPKPEEVQAAIFANRQQRQQLVERTRRSAIRADIEKQLGLDRTLRAAATDAAAGTSGAMGASGSSNTTQLTRSFSPAPMQFTNGSGDTVIRKHVTVWLGAVFAPTLVIIGGFAITAMSIASQTGWINQIGLPLAAVMFVVGVLWFWWSDWDWRNDMYIIGDDKVTLIHKRPLWLQNEVEQIRLERVDNVLSETSGIIDTMFQRGDVKLSLVGEGLDGAKVFQHVHRPHEIQAEVSRRQARARSNAEQVVDARQRDTIKEYLAVYHETIQDQGLPVAQAESSTAPAPRQFAPDVQPYQRHDQTRPPNVPRVQDRNRPPINEPVSWTGPTQAQDDDRRPPPPPPPP
jgi:CRP-like cAMP-binding protein